MRIQLSSKKTHLYHLTLSAPNERQVWKEKVKNAKNQNFPTASFVQFTAGCRQLGFPQTSFRKSAITEVSSTAQNYFTLIVILLGKILEALNNKEFIKWQNYDS